jgi:aminoglycoside 6'-N-acetyltransferase I
MKARSIRPDDRTEWLRLLKGLYPDTTDADHVPSVDAFLFGQATEELIPSAVFVIELAGGALCGFLELSVRNYAEGCTGDTPYIESWFVDQDQRRSGVGSALIHAAETWARERGYSELASDATLDNAISHAAHHGLGFEEVERTVHYRKSL